MRKGEQRRGEEGMRKGEQRRGEEGMRKGEQRRGEEGMRKRNVAKERGGGHEECDKVCSTASSSYPERLSLPDW